MNVWGNARKTNKKRKEGSMNIPAQEVKVVVLTADQEVKVFSEYSDRASPAEIWDRYTFPPSRNP